MERSAMHARIVLPRGDSFGFANRITRALRFAPCTLQPPPPQQVSAGQWKVNNIVAGTNFPKVPDEMIHNIIYENWKRALPEYVA